MVFVSSSSLHGWGTYKVGESSSVRLYERLQVPMLNLGTGRLTYGLGSGRTVFVDEVRWRGRMQINSLVLLFIYSNMNSEVSGGLEWKGPLKTDQPR